MRLKVSLHLASIYELQGKENEAMLQLNAALMLARELGMEEAERDIKGALERLGEDFL